MADLNLDARLSAAVATANGVAGAHPERFGMILERVMDRLPQKVRVYVCWVQRERKEEATHTLIYFHDSNLPQKKTNKHVVV